MDTILVKLVLYIHVGIVTGSDRKKNGKIIHEEAVTIQCILSKIKAVEDTWRTGHLCVLIWVVE